MNDGGAIPDLKRLGAVGRPLKRKEDARLLTGRGRFSDDAHLPDEAHAAIVRSPHPHAEIAAIDKRRALALPGVLDVLTGEDCRADGLQPIPHNPVPQTRYDLKLGAPGGGPIFIGPQLPLPFDKVRHVGEAVAMVVAETAAVAIDAAEAVAVEYRVLPWVAGTRASLAPDAPAVWDEVPDNVLVDTWFGDAAATDAAFAGAAHMVAMQFEIGRVTGAPIEPRAALGHFDPQTGRYTLWAGSGGAVRQKTELAAVLGVPADRVRVLSFDVGGNFGTRNRLYVESALVLWASRRLGRAVKYTATRLEVFLSDYQGRDLSTRVELALAADGRFLALRADNVSNVGARCASLSPLGKGSALVTGNYDIGAASLRSRAVFSNTTPTNAYRSSGRPEVTYAIERLIDHAAQKLGFDRVTLRRRNLIAPGRMPYANAIGARYDSGTYEANMDLAMRLADWDDFPARRAAAAARGRCLGRGLANYVESSIGAPRERCVITLTPEGRVEVVIGTGPSGQGHETSFAQVVSMLLEVPVEAVDIVTGDTDIVSLGGGSHSGRSMRHAATLLAKAAPDLIAKGRSVAAQLLETKAGEVAYADGRFTAPSHNRSFDFIELAKKAGRSGLSGELTLVTDNEMHDPVFPNGCAVCEIEVDPETGAIELTRYAVVDDVGRVINPLIVHGQSHGGIAQGVGEAMSEEYALDPDTGQPLAGSFLDYALPRADDLPSFTTRIVEVLSPTNPFGIKAGGEGGCTPALAVVVGAVLDALHPLGVDDLVMPLTSERIWRAIRQAAGKG